MTSSTERLETWSALDVERRDLYDLTDPRRDSASGAVAEALLSYVLSEIPEAVWQRAVEMEREANIRRRARLTERADR